MSCATSEVMVKAFEVVGKGAFKSGFCCHKKIHGNFMGYFGYHPQGPWAGRELQEQH